MYKDWLHPPNLRSLAHLFLENKPGIRHGAAAALARRLEREARVKLSPGSIYGEAPGTAHLRLNLATSRARLLEALDRIAPILGPAPDKP